MKELIDRRGVRVVLGRGQKPTRQLICQEDDKGVSLAEAQLSQGVTHSMYGTAGTLASTLSVISCHCSILNREGECGWILSLLMMWRGGKGGSGKACSEVTVFA